MMEEESPASGTITARLATFIQETTLDTIPPAVLHETKRIFLDTLGSMVAGITTRSGKVACDYASRFASSHLQATVPGRSTPFEVTYAAFANTILCNALDYEPVGPEGHVCAVVVPAALAVAETTKASGRALLEALVVGLEVGGRVGSALRRPSSRIASGIPPVRGTPHAIFGASACASRLLGLDGDQTRNALGIAGYSATLPTLRKAMDSLVMPMTKYDHLGKVTQSGVESALLAMEGFTGDWAIFEGELGFWRFSGALGCDWSTLTEGYGREWLIPQTWYKPYPCILYVTPGIQATVETLVANHLKPEFVEAIEIETAHLQTGQLIQTLDDPLAPWMNYRWNVAAAVYQVRPWRNWHRPEMVSADVKHFMEKITVKKLAPEAGTEHGYWEGWAPARVSIQAQGQTFYHQVQYLPRLDDDELVTKFLDNVSGLLDPRDVDRLMDAVWNLESIESVPYISSLLVKAEQ